MKLVSWNVNGVRAVMKKEFESSIRDIAPDILCLQETKAQDDEVIESLSGLSDFQVYTCSAERKGYSGTSILTKKPVLGVQKGIGLTEHDLEGRVLTLEMEDFYLVNVYQPNSGRGLVRLKYRKQWDAAFLEFLKRLDEKKPVISCGDFNVAHQPIDLARPKANYNKTAGYTQIEIDGFSALLEQGFTDTFRKLHPEEVSYTWWSYMFNARTKNIGWRIDYFVVSDRLLQHVMGSSMLPQYHGSDHCPIALLI